MHLFSQAGKQGFAFACLGGWVGGWMDGSVAWVPFDPWLRNWLGVEMRQREIEKERREGLPAQHGREDEQASCACVCR